MQAKPFHVWAQERAAAESAAERKLREAAIGSQAIGQGLDSLKPQPAPTVHKPTHDWDRSAMFAAERAAGLEKMDKGAQLERDNEEWKIKLHLKYAPKKGGGGAGPVSKTVAKLLELHKAEPTDETQAARVQQQIAFHENALRRYGKSGLTALEDLGAAGVTSAKYGASGKFGKTKELKQIDAGARTAQAQATADERAAIAEFNADMKASKPPEGYESDKEKADRLARVEAAKKKLRSRKVTAPGGGVFTVEDDGED